MAHESADQCLQTTSQSIARECVWCLTPLATSWTHQVPMWEFPKATQNVKGSRGMCAQSVWSQLPVGQQALGEIPCRSPECAWCLIPVITRTMGANMGIPGCSSEGTGAKVKCVRAWFHANSRTHWVPYSGIPQRSLEQPRACTGILLRRNRVTQLVPIQELHIWSASPAHHWSTTFPLLVQTSPVTTQKQSPSSGLLKLCPWDQAQGAS